MLGSEDLKLNNNISPVETKIENSNPEKSVVIPHEVARNKLADMFNIPLNDISKYDIDVKRIIDYVNTQNPETLDDFIYHVKALGIKLGNNPMEKQIKTISRYLYLINEKSKIDKDLERFNYVK